QRVDPCAAPPRGARRGRLDTRAQDGERGARGVAAARAPAAAPADQCGAVARAVTVGEGAALVSVWGPGMGDGGAKSWCPQYGMSGPGAGQAPSDDLATGIDSSCHSHVSSQSAQLLHSPHGLPEEGVTFRRSCQASPDDFAWGTYPIRTAPRSAQSPEVLHCLPWA